jgi:two-component system phosphate regulon response regulator PhoB
MKPKILVVDDEPDVIELVRFNLQNAGFDVMAAESGNEALLKARNGSPDAMILDLMLPEIDGLEVCKLLRRDAATARLPIIMLTSKAGEVDRILGLELGADDYLTKPFSPRELVLRVKKLLQRSREESSPRDRYQAGFLVLDVSKHSVTVRGRPVELTATEFKLLALLMERRGRVQSRDQLLQEVWGYERSIDTRTVDTHMRRLREKIGDAARYLETVRNVGYRFAEN